MKEYTIKFRNWGYAKDLYCSFWEHFICWCFGNWDRSNTCDIWEDTGFRIFGIEINKREYLTPPKHR
jgi:hypothetical protein